MSDGIADVFDDLVPGPPGRLGSSRAAAEVVPLPSRVHEVGNLYVVDASCFPSSGAVNPTLTIVANALRVGDRLSSGLT